MKSERIFLSIGSNLGDRLNHLQKGLELLCDATAGKIIKKSSVYETPPFGYLEQPSFYNAVAELQTAVEPEELLENIHQVEASCGRQRLIHWGPRTLDMDILLFGSRQMATKDLTIPHPGLVERHFVLEPWAEIAPEVMIPGLGTVEELLGKLPEAKDIKRVILATEW